MALSKILMALLWELDVGEVIKEHRGELVPAFSKLTGLGLEIKEELLGI